METKNVERLVADMLQTKLGGTMNNFVRNLVEVGESDDKRFIYFKLRSGRELYVDTYRNIYAASMKQLLKKNKVNCLMNRSGSSIRPCVSFRLPEDTNNSKPQLAVVIAIVEELYNGICRADYTGLSVNHKDLTGNLNQYGYTNNRIDNLEIVSNELNSIHCRAMERAQKMLGKHLSISATSPAMDIFRFGTESDLQNWFKSTGYKYVV